MSALSEFRQKFQLNELMLLKPSGWNISLRPAQPTPGSLILSLAREATSLAELTPEEGAQLVAAIHQADKLLTRAFRPDKINFLALMMVDAQVHFHVIPRYSRPVLFDGHSYQDVRWPGPPSVGDAMDINLSALLAHLRRQPTQ
jgi:diadenosine tetraphosphate (Ap4A) HIT family hydrolase